jgi:hypothetical protein
VMAILAAMQDQLDDLTSTVERQQQTIDELVRRSANRPSGQRADTWTRPKRAPGGQ